MYMLFALIYFSSLIHVHVHDFVFHHLYPTSVILPIGFENAKMFSIWMKWNEHKHNSQYLAVELKEVINNYLTAH